MKAPDKIYVEVCEDGIFAFPIPPFEESIEYIRKDVAFPKMDSTGMLSLWEQEKEILQSRDLRGDAMRMAYNAFLDGLAKGMTMNKEDEK